MAMRDYTADKGIGCVVVIALFCTLECYSRLTSQFSLLQNLSRTFLWIFVKPMMKETRISNTQSNSQE